MRHKSIKTIEQAFQHAGSITHKDKNYCSVNFHLIRASDRLRRWREFSGGRSPKEVEIEVVVEVFVVMVLAVMVVS